MTAGSTSALVGNPPNTQRDYYIVRGMDRTYGLSSADPNDGFTYLATEPSGYVHETKSVQVIVGLVILMLTILIPTVTRLVLRASNPAMEFGSDDWTIILAAVSFQGFALFLPWSKKLEIMLICILSALVSFTRSSTS